MFKHLPLFCVTLYFCLILCDASVIGEFYPFKIRNSNLNVDRKPESKVSKPVLPQLPVQATKKIKLKLDSHVTDFLNLINLEKVIRVFLKHASDPGVVNFIGFVRSKEFKKTIQQLQEIKEFKEMGEHLQSKGYDIKSVTDYMNSKLEVPAFGAKETANIGDGDGSGLTTVITEIIAVLSVENFKKLFEEKLEKHKELKDFITTVSSEEFVDIIVRLNQNPKYLKIRDMFERLGVNFGILKGLAKDIFGNSLKKVYEKI